MAGIITASRLSRRASTMWTTRLGIASLAALCALADVGADRTKARLMDAVKSGNREAVSALVKQPGAVNVPEADGTTALHWAVRADDIATTQLLLRAGAKPGVANRYGVTPISLAAINGNAAITEALLRAGADPNTTLAE